MRFAVRDSHVQQVISLIVEGLGPEWRDDKYRFRVVQDLEDEEDIAKKETPVGFFVSLCVFGDSFLSMQSTMHSLRHESMWCASPCAF